MANGIFVAASGATARLLEMDVMSNNLANASTIGHKKDQMTFESIEPENMSARPGNDDKHFVQVKETTTNFKQGTMLRTDNPMDLALRGDGFLHIDTPEGERLTRDGRLIVGRDGTLRHSQGHLVLDTKGEAIHLPPERVPSVSPDGRVLSGELEVATLDLVHVDLSEGLERDTAGFFMIPGPEKILTSASTEVLQGHLESGNSNAVQSMVQLIELQRSYEAMHQVISTYKQMDESAVRITR
jgi:flagellar basal body rod protein FlgG